MGRLLARFVERFHSAPVDSMKDWPDALRVNAAAIALAPHLYVALYEVVRGIEAPPPYSSLHFMVQQSWIQRAERAIRSVR